MYVHQSAGTSDESDALIERDSVLLRVVVPLDVPWVVKGSVLGRKIPIRAGSFDAYLCLPAVSDMDGRIIGLAPTGFEAASHLTEGWASITRRDESSIQVQTNSAAFEIAIRTRLPHTTSGVGSLSIQPPEAVVGPIHDWLERFNRWMHLLLGQMVDSSHPAPQLLNPPRTKQFVWASVNGTQTRINPSPGSVTIVQADEHTVLSEREIDERSLSELVRRASEPDFEVPLYLEMYASARRAALRSQRRLAIAELGTAAESALLQLLGLLPSKKRTLGRLIKEASAQGINLPADFGAVVQDPRDKAVHEGTEPDNATVLQAFEYVLQLISQLDPNLTSWDASAPAHRPQRLDLTFIKHGAES